MSEKIEDCFIFNEPRNKGLSKPSLTLIRWLLFLPSLFLQILMIWKMEFRMHWLPFTRWGHYIVFLSSGLAIYLINNKSKSI